MLKNFKTTFGELKLFLILWFTQSFSSLGSAMTNYALVIWSYEQGGEALTTSLLAICSYSPYVLLSIFAGAFSDRWNKKYTMLISDSVAAFCTVLVFFLMSADRLQIWHLYAINTLNGMMNTIQQPASDVAITLLTPKKHYQKVSGLRSLSNSFVTVLTPVIATAIFSFFGIRFVVLFDLFTFAAAFLSLLLFIKIPDVKRAEETEHVLQSAKNGLKYLKENRGILDLILFLAVINFTASMYNSALPAMVLSRVENGRVSLGMINMVTGIATIIGSIMVSFLPAPKSRVRVIFNTLLFSMSTENFILALGRSTPIWCISAVLGWLFIPLMSANMDVLLRSKIPVDIQGRVYAARNSLQFFTIPLGYLCGGLLVDKVFEPFMAAQLPGSLWVRLFGIGKGSGAAFLFLIIGLTGALSCLPFRRDKHIWKLEE